MHLTGRTLWLPAFLAPIAATAAHLSLLTLTAANTARQLVLGTTTADLPFLRSINWIDLYYNDPLWKSAQAAFISRYSVATPLSEVALATAANAPTSALAAIAIPALAIVVIAGGLQHRWAVRNATATLVGIPSIGRAVVSVPKAYYAVGIVLTLAVSAVIGAAIPAVYWPGLEWAVPICAGILATSVGVIATLILRTRGHAARRVSDQRPGQRPDQHSDQPAGNCHSSPQPCPRCDFNCSEPSRTSGHLAICPECGFDFIPPRRIRPSISRKTVLALAASSVAAAGTVLIAADGASLWLFTSLGVIDDPRAAEVVLPHDTSRVRSWNATWPRIRLWSQSATRFQWSDHRELIILYAAYDDPQRPGNGYFSASTATGLLAVVASRTSTTEDWQISSIDSSAAALAQATLDNQPAPSHPLVALDPQHIDWSDLRSGKPHHLHLHHPHTHPHQRLIFQFLNEPTSDFCVYLPGLKAIEQSPALPIVNQLRSRLDTELKERGYQPANARPINPGRPF